MSVTEESGGRLNAFAEEPKIEVLEQKSSQSIISSLLTIGGILLIIGISGFIISSN